MKYLPHVERNSQEPTYPFDTLLKLVINKEWEVLWRARVEVKKVLKISRDGLFEESIIVERLLEETIKSRLKVQKALSRRKLQRGDLI